VCVCVCVRVSVCVCVCVCVYVCERIILYNIILNIASEVMCSMLQA